MDVLISLAALGLLIVLAYRGYSVILVAPIAAMLAVFLTDPGAVPAVFTGLFMEKMASFVKLYFPVFLLGAVFGKLIELSGFSQTLVNVAIGLLGADRAIATIVLACAMLTYGGVSVFVVVFAAYPFAAQLFRSANIPKRLLPATIVLGAGTFAIDSLPGSPQIQNIIPTTFFGTTAWAAPVLGLFGSAIILAAGLIYLDRLRRRAQLAGEGYGEGHTNEPEHTPTGPAVDPLVAVVPLVLVPLANYALTRAIPHWYPQTVETSFAGMGDPIVTKLSAVTAIWAVEGAMIVGIAAVLVLAFRRLARSLKERLLPAVSGALLASINTASEYGFGAVIAALPGFLVIRTALEGIPDPLVNEAITVTTLAGVTGSASGGMSIALAAMADSFLAAGNAAGISPEVLHRIAAMASGGMDTLPHNGAIITILAVTGLTHRQAYLPIFTLTIIKTLAVFLVIAFYYATGFY